VEVEARAGGVADPRPAPPAPAAPPSLGVADLPVVPRDPHYFLPTPARALGGGWALFGRDAAATRASFLSLFTPADWGAHAAMQAELAQMRADFAPAMLAPPLPPGETAARFVRPALRRAFVALATGSVASYLDRWGFRCDLVRAMYAATDGLSGVTAGPDEPGTGFNFLLHNMVRLPGTQGAWALLQGAARGVVGCVGRGGAAAAARGGGRAPPPPPLSPGGMGTLTARLAGVARAAGVRIETGRPVAAVDVGAGLRATGVTLCCGTSVPARAVVAACDPFTLDGLIAGGLQGAAKASLDRARLATAPATTAKLQLCLSSLPTFACLPEPRGQHRTTSHLLVGAQEPRAASGAMAALARAAAAARAGDAPCEPGDHPPIEFYFHSDADPTVRDAAGRHSAALFVQLAPAAPRRGALDPGAAGWTPAAKAEYTKRLLSVVASFAPGIEGCVHEAVLFTPDDVRSHFGIASAHIHHVSNTLALDARFPHTVPGVGGLFCASAGTHPGGSVTGCGGFLAAAAAAAALGVAVPRVRVRSGGWSEPG